MESNAIVEAVNRLMLKPLGFVRRGSLFNRRKGDYVDVVDFPANKAGDAVTLEVGIQHDGLYETLWEAKPPRFSNEASCIVHARIDALVEGGETWWPLADPQSPDRAVKAVEGPVLRFLQGHHDLARIDARLAHEIAGHRSPRAMLYQAILRHRRGESVSSEALLEEVARGQDPDWAMRAQGLGARLKAAAPAPG